MRDSVFLAGKANRPADAIATLEHFEAKHPADSEATRELARLLVRNGRSDEGLDRYRQLLALSPDTAIRAEYAAALLGLQQYDSAAANYKILIAADSTSVDAHYGLARALAWSNHPREAEPELHLLVERRPSDSTLVAMLRLARDAYDPSSAEAAPWVAEDPAFPRYRLQLARALVREGHPELAMAQFDTVIAADASAPLPLIREAAGAHATAGDSVGNARLLGRAVALSPRDAALRRSYAEALAWAGDRRTATKQYDTLLTTNPTPELLIARGQLYELLGDGDAAERDLTQAAVMRPSPEAWVMLGDLYRWRGNADGARQAYARADMIHPGDAGAAAGIEQLALAQRRQAAALLAQDVGVFSTSSYLGDNAGFRLYAAGLANGVAVGTHTAITVGADLRRLGDVYGQSAELGLVNHIGRFRVAGDGGIMRYDQLGSFGYGALSAAGPWHNLWTSFEIRTGPTYQWLMSASRLTYTGANGALTVPLGAAALSVGVDQMWLSDGNARTSLQFGARYPLGFGLAALYSGGMIGFNHASDQYWDPHRFTSHALGLEYAVRHETGFSFSARVLPGIGLASEMFSDRADLAEQHAAQLMSGFALDYRRRWWGLTLDGDYANGVRQSGYHSARAGLRLRITP
ncbi:MAG TPA: tetratricopeptide repeat protein [Gemmatimonadaceae bacterium]|nr:tetratricopeptide repeat protein [Gemmatimonadaceae bacterium]